jgi:hypothetical protein
VRIIPAFLLTGLLALSAACGCAPIEREPVTPITGETPIRSVVVLPTTSQLDHNSVAVNVYQLREGADDLDQLHAEYFAGIDAIDLLPEERQEALSAELTGSPLERARRIGQKLGSDAVLLTVIERYFERQGTTYAVDSPASVAFRYQLIRVDSGRVACTGQFSETQQPLSQNIFAFPQAASRGFKWLTARELAQDGLRRKLSECEPLQQLRPGGP